MATGITCLGLFGVLTYAVAQRTHELGIRMALGARASSVVALIIRGGLRPVIVGAAVGLVTAAALAKTMSSLLFGVQPLDPLTFAFVLALVLFTAVVACVLPARWATRVDASSALRSE